MDLSHLQFMLSYSRSLIIASKGKKSIVPRLKKPTATGDQSYDLADAKNQPLSVNQWRYKDAQGRMLPCFWGKPSSTICKPITDVGGRLAGLVDEDGNQVMTSYMPLNGQLDESRRVQGIAIDNSGSSKENQGGRRKGEEQAKDGNETSESSRYEEGGAGCCYCCPPPAQSPAPSSWPPAPSHPSCCPPPDPSPISCPNLLSGHSSSSHCSSLLGSRTPSLKEAEDWLKPSSPPRSPTACSTSPSPTPGPFQEKEARRECEAYERARTRGEDQGP